MICPSCQNTKWYYIERPYEYHVVEDITEEDGEFDIVVSFESMEPTDDGGFFECTECGYEKNVELNQNISYR